MEKYHKCYQICYEAEILEHKIPLLARVKCFRKCKELLNPNWW